MFTLQGLRSPQRMKWLFKSVIFFGFGLLIISFIFFYGWQSDGTSPQNPEYAKVRSENVLPWKRWTPIRRELMSEGQQRALFAKQISLPSQYRQFLEQQGIRLDGLVTLEDSAREAANAVLIEREIRDQKVFVPRDEILEQIKQQPGVTNEML